MCNKSTAAVGISLSNQHSHYWANWDPCSFAPNILRRDTRIFWEQQSVGTVGKCVGTFYGENPGGGESIHGQSFCGYSPIVSGKKTKQSGDPTLKLIFDTWKNSASVQNKNPRSDDYIEILNLYYFREPQSGVALNAWRKLGGATFYNPGISSSSSFVLLGWGKNPNAYPEAGQALKKIASLTTPKIIIPKQTMAHTILTNLSISLPHYPATPSGCLQSGLKKDYIQHVGAVI